MSEQDIVYDVVGIGNAIVDVLAKEYPTVRVID